MEGGYVPNPPPLPIDSPPVFTQWRGVEIFRVNLVPRAFVTIVQRKALGTRLTRNDTRNWKDNKDG